MKILLNACTHGDEKVGLRVLEHFKDSHLVETGALTLHVANKEAVSAGKRFIDKDLNRVFPGKPDGCYEERLADSLVPFIKKFDFVIDIHSTNTGVESAVILNDFSEEILPIVRALGPKRALVMSATKSHSLISVARLAIAFECGKDTDDRTYRETVDGVEKILRYFGLLNGKIEAYDKTLFLEAFKSVPKPPGFIVSNDISNFNLVTKGQLLGTNPDSGAQVFAQEDFYPILFGNNTYTEIFGFAGKKVNMER